MNKQAVLQKLAQVRLAINHVLRQRMMKQAAPMTGAQPKQNPKIKTVSRTVGQQIPMGTAPATNRFPNFSQAELDRALQDLRSIGYKETPTWYRRGTQLNQQTKQK